MKRPGSLIHEVMSAEELDAAIAEAEGRFCACDVAQGRGICAHHQRSAPNERAWRVVDVICTILVVSFLAIAVFGGFKP